jgi:predicted RNase H-like nuclease (RuvC/YqgF family)
MHWDSGHFLYISDPQQVYAFLQESLKKLGISKDGTITSLRLEKTQLTTKLDEQKQELEKIQGELKQVRIETHDNTSSCSYPELNMALNIMHAPVLKC